MKQSNHLSAKLSFISVHFVLTLRNNLQFELQFNVSIVSEFGTATAASGY